MREATQARVDDFWAGTLPGPAAAVGDVTIGPHCGLLSGYEGVYAVDRGGRTVVSVPPAMLPRVCELLPSAAEAMSPEWWTGALPGWVVLGPSVHSFLDDPSSLRTGGDVRSATRSEIEEALRERVSPAEWEEGGFASGGYECAWLLVDEGGQPAAAANLSLFDGAPVDVGVITAADSRGRGHAAQVASAAARWALDGHGIVRWRAVASNLPSRRLARSLAFTDDAQQLAVRPPR